MRISDWSSDVCSSDLFTTPNGHDAWVGWDPAEGWSTWDDPRTHFTAGAAELVLDPAGHINPDTLDLDTFAELEVEPDPPRLRLAPEPFDPRSEEHTSELQSLMRISYAVFCLKKKK